MAKNTAQDIKDLGFVPEWFQGQNTTTFDAFLQGVLSEQADILEGRIGTARYADTTKANATFVKQAERSLVCAELCRRRLLKLAGDINSAEGADAVLVRKTKDEYAAEAEKQISRISEGSAADGDDFATGYNESSHFDEDAADA